MKKMLPIRRVSAVRTFRSASVLCKKQEFLLAPVGEGISEVEIIQFYVKPGDKVSQFDKIVDVQTDKATVEITSRYDGIVKSVNYEIGKIAKVGTSLITLEVDESVEDSADSADSKVNDSIDSSSAKPSVAESTNKNENVLTIPAVRRLAKENNIDLSQVIPTGPGGRILKEDVLKYMNQSASPASNENSAKVNETKTKSIQDVKIAHAVKSSFIGADTVHKISGIQRIMVKSMSAAVQIPAFGLNEDVIMNQLINVRNSLKSEAQKHGIKLSYLPFLIKSASQALKHYPMINSFVNEDCTEVTMKAEHNIGIAMDTPRGLLVPNVKRVQDLSILEIAAELNRLQALGAEGKLGQEELSNGTFTLSNIGSIGGRYASPIIFVPQVAIGALGKTQVVPRYDSNGSLYPCSVLPVSWSADHRVIDGAAMTRFSNLFKKYIENPEIMLLESR
jgi:2-oxoisovalerate dehydrogenase E2 component (dihydrolipoyl transacylase)